MKAPENPSVYHMTYAGNLGSILSSGGLYCDAKRLDKGLKNTSIGHQTIKERRMRKAVSICRLGVLGDYVPFYFCNRSPMLYTIERGNVEGYSQGQTRILYLVSSLDTLRKAGCDWFFTDGHAVEAISDYYPANSDLSAIDWPVIGDRSWANTESDNDRKRRKQAECLVHDFFRWEWVERIGVHSDKARDWVESQLQSVAHRPDVEIQREWYY